MGTGAMSVLIPTALTQKEFEPFGDVIEGNGAFLLINGGFTKRFHDLARVETLGEDARAMISLFRVNAQTLPISIRMMERHPLGSQAFIPLRSHRFLVVVARPGGPPGPEDLRAFWSNGNQGVNYRAGVWHHPVLALVNDDEFLVIDRGGPGDNCDECFFAPAEERTLQW